MKTYSLFLSILIFLSACQAPSSPGAASIAKQTGRPSLAENMDSWQAGPFIKADLQNPILLPSKTGVFISPIRRIAVRWELKDVFNPAAVIRNGKVMLIYRAQDSLGKPGGTSRLGLAESTDGLHFIRHKAPVFFPGLDTMKKYEWEGGCEDPRIVQDSAHRYYMTYTAFDGKLARMAIARSSDLIHWKKMGLAFSRAEGGRYRNMWSKSGAIISKLTGNECIAQRINGKYWMYWGDDSLKVATSADLVNWAPLKDSKGQFITIAAPRRGMFDSRLCEPGPPPLIRADGILFIYNGMNAEKGGSAALAPGTYSGGQLLISATDPLKVLKRLSIPFIKPDKAYEISGQVNRVCFLEGMVPFKNKWFLYYGTADSKIAAATAEGRLTY